MTLLNMVVVVQGKKRTLLKDSPKMILLSSPKILWEAHRHVALLRFGHPKFESFPDQSSCIWSVIALLCVCVCVCVCARVRVCDQDRTERVSVFWIRERWDALRLSVCVCLTLCQLVQRKTNTSRLLRVLIIHSHSHGYLTLLQA